MALRIIKKPSEIIKMSEGSLSRGVAYLSGVARIFLVGGGGSGTAGPWGPENFRKFA